MARSIQDMREARAEKVKQSRAILDKTAQDQNVSTEDQDAINKLYADIDALDQSIELEEKQLKLEAANSQRIEDRASNKGISLDEAENQLNEEGQAFNAWLRGGTDQMNPEQRALLAGRHSSSNEQAQNVLSTGTGSQGGYLVPEGFGGRLIEELKEMGGVRGSATHHPTEMGNPVPYPTVDDTDQEGELVAENAAAAKSDPTFGTVRVAPFLFSSKVVTVPFALLQDSGIGLEGYINGLLGTRLHRATNKYFTNGTGSDQPRGIVTASAEGHVTASGQTDAIGYADLVNLEHSVDAAYRNKAKWMFHDNTVRALKLLMDGHGRPLWMPGLTGDEPDTLLRYPYAINNHMDQLAANKKPVIFGDLGNYVVRDVKSIILLRFDDSRYMESGQIGFLAWMRSGGNLLSATGNCVKHLKTANG